MTVRDSAAKSAELERILITCTRNPTPCTAKNPPSRVANRPPPVKEFKGLRCSCRGIVTSRRRILPRGSPVRIDHRSVDHDANLVLLQARPGVRTWHFVVRALSA